ncbi:hypothetical protein [Pilimelia anulata]|nr:hypothetical protein [Pilimelia anulata]
MVARSPRRGATRWQPPLQPSIPLSYAPAVLPEHDPDHEVSFDRVDFDGLDLTGRRAGSHDLIALSHALAGALGIQIRD